MAKETAVQLSKLNWREKTEVQEEKCSYILSVNQEGENFRDRVSFCEPGRRELQRQRALEMSRTSCLNTTTEASMCVWGSDLNLVKGLSILITLEERVTGNHSGWWGTVSVPNNQNGKFIFKRHWVEHLAKSYKMNSFRLNTEPEHLIKLEKKWSSCLW